MKTLYVIGTRPEVFKTVPVVHELRRFRGRAEVEIWVTGAAASMVMGPP